jgi:hypothetical protein
MVVQELQVPSVDQLLFTLVVAVLVEVITLQDHLLVG